MLSERNQELIEFAKKYSIRYVIKNECKVLFCFVDIDSTFDLKQNRSRLAGSIKQTEKCMVKDRRWYCYITPVALLKILKDLIFHHNRKISDAYFLLDDIIKNKENPIEYVEQKVEYNNQKLINFAEENRLRYIIQNKKVYFCLIDVNISFRLDYNRDRLIKKIHPSEKCKDGKYHYIAPIALLKTLGQIIANSDIPFRCASETYEVLNCILYPEWEKKA
jgi:hypothetical protein